MTLDEPCGGTREPEWMRLARLHEAEQREQERLEAEVRASCESPEAAAAFWQGAFRGSARHYAGSQSWDGHDGRQVRLHAERVVDGLDADPSTACEEAS